MSLNIGRVEPMHRFVLCQSGTAAKISFGELALRSFSAGSFFVVDVEDAHPQHDHAHAHHEDGTIEISIFRMPGPSCQVIYSIISYNQINAW
jgi:hypothetical protein